MYQAIGFKSKKVYHTGETHAEVHRKLLEQYPSYIEKQTRKDETAEREVQNARLFQEPLMIERVK